MQKYKFPRSFEDILNKLKVDILFEYFLQKGNILQLLTVSTTKSQAVKLRDHKITINNRSMNYRVLKIIREISFDFLFDLFPAATTFKELLPTALKFF